MKQIFKNHKKLFITICVILIAAVAVTVVLVRRNATNSTTSSEETGTAVYTLAKQDLSTSISTSGTVESASVTEVTTDVSAQVKELYVELGDHVEEGDVLCVLDSDSIQEQIAEIEASNAQTQKTNDNAKAKANNELAAAQEALQRAQSTYDSIKALVDAQEVEASDEETQSEALVSAASNLASAKQAVIDAQAAVDEANNTSVSSNSELKKLQQQLSHTTITATQSGIITQLNVSKGSIPSGSLMKIEDDTNLKVTVTIKEKDILKLQTGMEATITSDAIGDDQVFRGSVDKVINFSSASSSSDSSSSGGYSATISVEPGSQLLLGMTVKTKILLNSSGEQLAAPYDAIVTDGSDSYIYVAKPLEDGTYQAVRVDVTTGDSNDYYTGIASDELSEGDYIVAYPDLISEGDTFSVYELDGDLTYTTSESED